MTSPPNERSRPVQAAPVNSTPIKSDFILPPTTGRRFWARQLIERAKGSIPAYGSTEWIHADEVTRMASATVAAECWATSGDNLEEDLRREIEASQFAFKTGEDAEYRSMAADHRARYASTKGGKSFTERRAAQLAAVEPRPGDYLGKSGGAK